jgi:hypothetical protein
MYHSVKEWAVQDCEIELAPKVGGEMHLPMELLEILEAKA